jgi:hypothetical protein
MCLSVILGNYIDLITSVQQLSDVQPMGLFKPDLLQEPSGVEH